MDNQQAPSPVQLRAETSLQQKVLVSITNLQIIFNCENQII